MGDLRVCFVGDSFVAGVGDPEHLAWVGRLAARSSRAGRPLTAYHLGVRRQTSRDVSKRWLLECGQRLLETADSRVVFSFGVNAPPTTGPALVCTLTSQPSTWPRAAKAAGRGWAAIVVGPPPVADAEHNQRLEQLDALFGHCCREAAVPYVSTFEPMRYDEAWRTEVQRSDGAHPAAGYQQLAELVWPTWREWTTAAPERQRPSP